MSKRKAKAKLKAKFLRVRRNQRTKKEKGLARTQSLQSIIREMTFNANRARRLKKEAELAALVQEMESEINKLAEGGSENETVTQEA